MNAQFDGSAEQRRILKLREVEGQLQRIQVTATLLSRCAAPADVEAVELILDEANEAIARLAEVER